VSFSPIFTHFPEDIYRYLSIYLQHTIYHTLFFFLWSCLIIIANWVEVVKRNRIHINMHEELVTPQSLALSLAAPRAPPVGSTHRHLLSGKDPRGSFLTHHHHEIAHDIHIQKKQQGHHANVQYHHGLHHRVQKLLESNFVKLQMPHPHLSFAPDSGDRITRYLGSTLPIWWQHRNRDDGTFRSISDGIVTSSLPSIAFANFNASRNFLKLTANKVTLKYGRHKSQFVDMFLPTGEERRGLVFFVHGEFLKFNRLQFYNDTASSNISHDERWGLGYW